MKYGAANSSNFEKHTQEVDKMEELFSVIPIYGVLDEFAKEKSRLKKAGNLIPDFDLLIGVTSTMNNLVLVSNNVKHLGRINNVNLENWKKPS